MANEKTHDWAGIAAQSAFKELLAARARFVIPATIFFIVYYFTLPIAVGYFPEVMSKKVWGQVNLAYLFALSQFLMTWVVAALYVKKASGFDRQAEALIAGRPTKAASAKAKKSSPKKKKARAGK